MKKISVITPVYFNAESLLLHFASVKEQKEILFSKYGVSLELIYVNDGSGDNSLEVLRSIKETHQDWVTVISMSRNFGSLRAIRAGFFYATGDCVTYLSADLQDPASLISSMVKAWQNGYGYVICVRQSRKDPLLSMFFSRLFYFLARRMILSSYPKGGFDVFLLDKKYLQYVKTSGKNFNIILLSYWLGIKPYVIKYTRQKRVHGKSRWTFRKKIRLMIDSFVGFSTVPINIISVIALFVSTASFVYGMFIFFDALLGNIPVPGYATTICLMSFLFGLIILMLTIIAEYLVRIYDEVSNKPEYIIEEIF